MTHEEDLMHKRMKRLLKKSETGKVEFKNYKDMCTQLKLPVKTGNAKKSQIKYLNCFCNLEQGEKYSLIITEVYDNPDNTMIEKKFMVKSIETLLLATFLKKQEENPPSIILDTFSLWRLFGFINYRYGSTSEEEKFIKANNISKEQLSNFKSRSRSRFEDIITPALNQLDRRALIDYNTIKIIRINTKDDIIEREPTDEELSRILSYERRSLKKFNCEDITEIWNKSLETEYYSYLNKLIREKEKERGWIKISNGIKIVTNNKKWLKDGLDRNINELEVKYKVNKEILSLLQKNAETKFNNYTNQIQKEYSCYEKFGHSFDSVKKRLPTYNKRHELMEDNYIASQEALMNYFIDMMEPKIIF